VSFICAFLAKEIADYFDEEWYSSQQNISTCKLLLSYSKLRMKRNIQADLASCYVTEVNTNSQTKWSRTEV
jgi:hypothetical protein